MGAESEDIPVTPKKPEAFTKDSLTPEKFVKPGSLEDEEEADKVVFGQSPVKVSSQRWHSNALGVNAQVDSTGRMARRARSFNKAIVFCVEPASTCKLRVLQMEECWDGSLQLGFSLRNPGEFAFKEETLFMEFMDHMAVSSIEEPWHRRLDIGSVIEWTLQASGAVSVVIDGRSFTTPRILPSQIKTSVYPCAGIYGNVTAIQLLP